MKNRPRGLGRGVPPRAYCFIAGAGSRRMQLIAHGYSCVADSLCAAIHFRKLVRAFIHLYPGGIP